MVYGGIMMVYGGIWWSVAVCDVLFVVVLCVSRPGVSRMLRVACVVHPIACSM